VAKDSQGVAHEAALAGVDLIALARDLVRRAEEDRVADRERRPPDRDGGFQVDADAARGRAGGEDK
jgi:hypothetical protein